MLRTPKHKAGNLKTPDYYLFQGQDQKNFFFTLKYIHGSVHFMQKILLSLSETMIKLHLFKMHSVKPFQSLICPANACQSIQNILTIMCTISDFIWLSIVRSSWGAWVGNWSHFLVYNEDNLLVQIFLPVGKCQNYFPMKSH